LSLQTRYYFGSFVDVRQVLALWLVVFFVSSTHGQEQERKLVDRLLKPDMTLQTTEQNKKFVADKTLIDRPAPVSAFYLQKKSNEKNFAGTRNLSSQSFSDHRSSPAQSKSASISSRTRAPNSAYPTPSPKQLNSVHDADKRRSTKDFGGNRPFLEQGKSQKSLTRQNTPLTIEQVRELLNKNK
jgi:hypothetical protein